MEAFATEDELHEQPIHTATLIYSVDDKPSWPLSLVLAIQHLLPSVAAAVTFPLFLGSALCILDFDPVRDQLVSSVFFVSGVSTLLQSTFGVRLPIVQGPSIALTACVVTFLRLPNGGCPSDAELYAMGAENRTAEWQDRMLEVQGAVISVSLLIMLLGYSGLIGLILRYMSPLIIAPTITTLGLSMMSAAAEKSSENFYVAFSALIVLVIFWQFFRNVNVPILLYGRSEGFYFTWIHVFQMFPTLLCVVLVSAICCILANYQLVLWNEQLIPTDNALFHALYPLKWGLPRFTFHSVAAALTTAVVSIVASIGNYYSCAAICGKPLPPLSAISRGIGIEGVSCLLAGLFGTGSGIASVTSDVGSIGISKVGNRRVIVTGSIIMIIISLFPPLRGVLYTIPMPVIGALTCVMVAMVTAVGLSYLQYVNMKSHRNLFVLGCGFFCGIIPQYAERYQANITTGYEVIDVVVHVLSSNNVFVTSLVTFILDNLIPGKLKDRGILTCVRAGGTSNNYGNNNINELRTYRCPNLPYNTVRKNALICIAKTQCL